MRNGSCQVIVFDADFIGSVELLWIESDSCDDGVIISLNNNVVRLYTNWYDFKTSDVIVARRVQSVLSELWSGDADGPSHITLLFL